MFKLLGHIFRDQRGTTLTFTYSFSPNTLIQSSHVNQNNTDIAAVVNALTADNLADDAVTAAKLNSDVVRSGYGLIQHSDGSLYVDVSDTNPCLEITDGGLRLKVDGVTLERASGGVQCVSTKVAFLDTTQTFTGAKTFSAACDFLSVETDSITLGGVAVNTSGGLLTTAILPASAVLSNTSDQSTTDTSPATVDFGATDYIEIESPNANDEFLVIFSGTYNQNSGSYGSNFAIQENSSGSYATIASSLRYHRQYGDGSTYDSFCSVARITGKSSTFRVQAVFYVSSTMTLTIMECTMHVIKLQRR